MHVNKYTYIYTYIYTYTYSYTYTYTCTLIDNHSFDDSVSEELEQIHGPKEERTAHSIQEVLRAMKVPPSDKSIYRGATGVHGRGGTNTKGRRDSGHSGDSDSRADVIGTPVNQRYPHMIEDGFFMTMQALSGMLLSGNCMNNTLCWPCWP